MNDETLLQLFNNPEFGDVRTLEVDGKILFVAKDIAKALGYVNTNDAIIKHCKGVVKREGVSITKNQYGIETRQTSEMAFIPEGDVYRLIVKAADQTRNEKISEKAAKFESWIYDEVLPTIRKHGLYATDNVIDNILNNPDFGIELLTKLKEERTARVKAEQTNAILMHVNKTYTATEIAKELNLKSAIALNKILENLKVQYNMNGTWVMYSKYSDCGYEEIKQEVLDNGKVIYHRKITQLGREFIINLVTEYFKNMHEEVMADE